MKPVLILLAIFFLIYYLRKRSAKPLQKARGGGDPQPKKAAEEMVLDTVCNSYIPVSFAISLNENGAIEYFCSEECRNKYILNKA